MHVSTPALSWSNGAEAGQGWEHWSAVVVVEQVSHFRKVDMVVGGAGIVAVHLWRQVCVMYVYIYSFSILGFELPA